jgi:multidrug resistance efflux pump
MDKGPGRFRAVLLRAMERAGVRLVGLVVFLGSVALLASLQSTQVGLFRARAVAQATSIEHPALLPSYVATVHVRPGDAVEPGSVLAELSSHFVDRELTRLEAEIARVARETQLAEAEVVVDEERWLEQSLRRRPNRPSIQAEIIALHEAQIAELSTRRAQLLEDRKNAVIRSRGEGRVSFVAPVGSAVAIGTSVATVVPEHADEIVAYVPVETDPTLIARGVEVRVFDSQVAECRASATVRRRGAGVVEAPGQLERFLGLAVHGLPVYISVPAGCPLGVGQVVTVEFPKAGA